MPAPPDESRTLECASQSVFEAQLTVISGPSVGRRYRVGTETTIGRSSQASIVVDDAEVSRWHARIRRTEAGGILVEDAKSRNGTFVNGLRVERRALSFGDKLSIGRSLVLRLDAFDPEAEEIAERKRFENIGRLSVGIAHDLGNVVSTLLAGTDYLVRLEPGRRLGDGDVRECIADIGLAADRAGELLRSLLSGARGHEIPREPVDVSELVTDLVRMLRYTLDTGISIQSTITPGLFVDGWRSELHQVLLNLALNARDAMPRGGVLGLRARRVMTVPKDVDWKPGRPAVCLVVEDNGSGMDEVTSRRIFEPFFTTKREGIGFGLGLATVRDLVIRHEGRIAFESVRGQGTTFTVYLPLHTGRAKEVATRPLEVPVVRRAPAGEAPAVCTARILLVDDEQIVRRSMGRLLRMAGCEVVEAGSGAEALELFPTLPFDLVLLDSHMPEMDGLETQAKLLQQKPKARIAFATGHVDPTLYDAGRAKGAVGFLQKPYSASDVIKLATQLLDSGDDDSSDFEIPTRYQ